MAKKKSEDKDLTLLKVKLDRQWSTAQNNRKEMDWQWFMYDLWVNGDHYAKWDKNTQQIITTIRDKGRVKVVINKIYSTLRAVRNFSLRNRPKAEVTPDNLSPENIDEANRLNQLLDFLHDKLYLRRKLKGTLWHALKYSVGFWQVLWNDEDGDGLGEVAVNMVDPYDLYWDPIARDPNEARYAVLAVRRNIEDLKNDPKYQIEDIKGDELLAASSMKSRLLQAEKGMATFGENKSTSTVIVREHWYKEFTDEEVDDGQGNKTKIRKPKIMICAIAGDKIIRPPEDTGLTKIPFFRLQSDVEPLSMYGTGWVKNLISPNRLLDRLESQVAEYNDIMNKGKWVADKGSGVRVINNENGQIIEKKRGYEVSQQPIAPMSASIFQQIENVNRYLEDLGGAHDASLGRIPPGAKSGNALEALQVGDSNNLSEIVENVEEFLEEVYEYILSIIADKYQVARRIVPTTAAGEKVFMDVVGENANKDVVSNNAVVVPKKNIVDVKISSWLAQTPEARRNVLKELYQLQAIDQETLLEGYAIGPVAQIIEKTRKQKLMDAATNIEVGATQAQATQQATTPPAPPQEGKMEAIAAIRTIVQGGKPIMPKNPSGEYVQYIDMFLSAPEAKTLPKQIMQALIAFKDQITQMGGQMQAQPQPQAPVVSGM